jgi:hypothetical protein
MPYQVMYGLSIATAIAIGVCGAIQLADADTLGISQQFVEWTKIVVVGLGILQGFLPSVRKPPSDDRVGMD